MTRGLKDPLNWVIYGVAVIVAVLHLWVFLVSIGPNYPKRTVPVKIAPLTPFHHQLAQAGRWDISKEVAALIPKKFDEAVEFVGASASSHRPSSYSLGPKAEEEPITKVDKEEIRLLRSAASYIFPDRELLRGAAFTVRLDGTETATFDSFVRIYLFEPAGGGLLVSAERSDGTVFYPL